MFRVNNKDTRTKPIEAIVIYFDINQNVNIFYRAYRKLNWNKSRIKNKIYYLLWTDFITRPNVFVIYLEQMLLCVPPNAFIVDFEHIRAAWWYWWYKLSWCKRRSNVVFKCREVWQPHTHCRHAISRRNLTEAYLELMLTFKLQPLLK